MTKTFESLGRLIGKHFWPALGILLGIKFLLAGIFPITADEAYFWQWGQHPALFYYDHSSMTAFWMALGQLLGRHIFYQRLVGILAFLIVTLVLRKITKSWTRDTYKADLISLAFFVSPVQFLFFMITTDTPLFFFGFFAALFFAYGFRKDSLAVFFGAGVCLGLAVFSKYLIFFLAVGMALSLLWYPKRKRLPLAVLALLVGILPFLVLHFWIAQQACWWPLQFNVFNRSEGKTPDVGNFIAFLIQQIFLLTPWILWGLFEERRRLRNELRFHRQPYVLIFLGGLIALGFLSLYETGLHWGLSLYPLIYLSLWIFRNARLERILAYSTILSLLVTSIVFVLLALVPRIYVGGRYYADYVMGRHGDEVHAALLKIGEKLDRPVFGTLGYTTAGLMDYHSDRHYLVFKDIDTNGRNDDFWTDYRALDGRDFLLISTYAFRPEEIEEYREYFNSIEYVDLNVRQGQFYLALGKGFRFPAYQAHYLTWANKQFYPFRSFLPPGQCFFHEKYFPMKKE